MHYSQMSLKVGVKYPSVHMAGKFSLTPRLFLLILVNKKYPTFNPFTTYEIEKKFYLYMLQGIVPTPRIELKLTINKRI